VTCRKLQQAGNTSQEARLAAAIGTLDNQQFAGIQRKIELLKQATVAAQQAKVIR
jgi:hypothetical protein